MELKQLTEQGAESNGHVTEMGGDSEDVATGDLEKAAMKKEIDEEVVAEGEPIVVIQGRTLADKEVNILSKLVITLKHYMMS